MTKMNRFSQVRRWGILSLVLLSPEILAGENLNMDYSGAGKFSLEPRLGLTARACHSLADPIDIKFEFGEMLAPDAIYLKLNGENYTKGYAVLNPVSGGGTVADARKDPDFQVPWHVHISGNVQGNYAKPVSTQAIPDSYNYPFCFAHGHPYNSYADWVHNSYGYFPIFRPEYFNDVSKYYQMSTPDANAIPQEKYNWDNWNRYCKGRKTAAENGNYAPNLVWGDPKDKAPNNEIKHQVALNEEFLMKNLFYISRTPGTPAGVTYANTRLGPVRDYDSRFNEVSYSFPIDSVNDDLVFLESGHFSVKLDNRNITSMTLTIFSNYSQGYKSVWTWSRDGDNHALMRLAKTGNIGIDPVSNQDNSDPYSVLGFYKKQALSHFKGTLVAASSLTDGFKNHVPPLSLPPASDGDFSLVNTDSLTFSIGQPRVGGGQGNWTLSVLGQPLKFAPLYINNKEAVSAMQMRNACY
ncbi:TPA: hypothetical protein ACIA3T_004647 [Salmonella enterica subsp. enterica serovar Saintpaul]